MWSNLSMPASDGRAVAGAEVPSEVFSPRIISDMIGLAVQRRAARLVDVHGIAKIPDNPLGALAAGLEFVGIASFAMQHLLVADGHTAPTNPVLAITRVNMVEIGQRATSVEWIR